LIIVMPVAAMCWSVARTLEQITQTQGGTEGPFDPAFGRTGGEDSMLFRRLDESGSRMVWCDDAPALEFVPIAPGQHGCCKDRFAPDNCLCVQSWQCARHRRVQGMRSGCLSAQLCRRVLPVFVIALMLFAP
jgi:hypothetical protein